MQLAVCYAADVRCLVTGSTGFVGGALVRALVGRGDQVVVTVRGEATTTGAITTVRADVGDPDAIVEAATGCEVVFHCAGIASARADASALEWVNVAGTENVINAARHAQARRVVLLSCADVSLVNVDRIHWSESRVITTAPLDMHARTKLLAEEVALSASDQRLEVTALRPAWLWGPGDHTQLPWLCAEGLNGGVRLHGNGENLFAFTYIDNLVTGMIKAASAKHAPGRAYYVADGDVLTAREFFAQLSLACGLPAPRKGIFALDYASAWWRARMTDQHAVVSDVVKRGRGTLFDVQAAVRDLDFAPKVTVETGMRALQQWITGEGGAAVLSARRKAFVPASSVDEQIRRADAHRTTAS
jgi:nucleoside-diphosphate-sugar epimerase